MIKLVLQPTKNILSLKNKNKIYKTTKSPFPIQTLRVCLTKGKHNAPLTQTLSHASILSVLPKAVDPVMLRQAWVVAPRVAHWSPNGATHLLHPYGLRPIHSGRLDGPVGGNGATEEGSVVAATSVGRAELLLLLTLGGHPGVRGLADPIGKSGDRILRGEGPPTGRMWGESWVGWGQVVVQGSLGS